MKSYNIYAGLKGRFGGAMYQYTGIYDSEAEAMEDAEEVARANYEDQAGLTLPSTDEIMNNYCLEYDIEIDNLENDDYSIINDRYEINVQDWIDYHIVATEEDDIDQEDLILDYIVDDGSPGKASSDL